MVEDGLNFSNISHLIDCFAQQPRILLRWEFKAINLQIGFKKYWKTMKTLFPYKMVLFWIFAPNIVLVEGLQGLCKMRTIWIKDLLYVNDLAQRYKVNKIYSIPRQSSNCSSHFNSRWDGPSCVYICSCRRIMHYYVRYLLTYISICCLYVRVKLRCGKIALENSCGLSQQCDNFSCVN